MVSIGPWLQQAHVRVYGKLGIRRETDPMGTMNNSELLKELRIERNAPAPTSRKPPGIALAVIALGGRGAGGWYALAGSGAVPVHVASAQAMTAQAAASTSVLDATG